MTAINLYMLKKFENGEESNQTCAADAGGRALSATGSDTCTKFEVLDRLAAPVA